MARFVQEFEWDPAKALANRRKHGVTFQQASEEASRSAVGLPWVEMGGLILVIHTYNHAGKGVARIRIVSARKPTKVEIRDYEEQA